MAKYLLDTNITSILGRDLRVLSKLRGLSDSDIVCISVLTLYETYYGFKNCKDVLVQKEIEQNIKFMKTYFEIIPLDVKEMKLFAQLKTSYKDNTGINSKEAKKNDIDFLIASSAIAKDAILVSKDKIFSTLSKLNINLKYECW